MKTNECEHSLLSQVMIEGMFAYKCEHCKRVWEWAELEYIIRYGVSPYDKRTPNIACSGLAPTVRRKSVSSKSKARVSGASH